MQKLSVTDKESFYFSKSKIFQRNQSYSKQYHCHAKKINGIKLFIHNWEGKETAEIGSIEANKLDLTGPIRLAPFKNAV